MAHPAKLDCTYEEKADRVTIFFRCLLLIPHIIWLGLYGIPVIIVQGIATLVLLFTAKYPKKMWEYVLRYVRYQLRVNAYANYLTDVYPPFNGKAETSYPLTFSCEYPGKWCWFKFILRIVGILFLLLPTWLIVGILGILTPTQGGVSLFSGKRDKTLHGLQVKCMRYMARLSLFIYCMIDDMPNILFYSLEEVE